MASLFWGRRYCSYVKDWYYYLILVVIIWINLNIKLPDDALMLICLVLILLKITRFDPPAITLPYPRRSCFDKLDIQSWGCFHISKTIHWIFILFKRNICFKDFQTNAYVKVLLIWTFNLHFVRFLPLKKSVFTWIWNFWGCFCYY